MSYIPDITLYKKKKRSNFKRNSNRLLQIVTIFINVLYCHLSFFYIPASTVYKLISHCSIFLYTIQFPDGKYRHNSTNRIDFRSYGKIHPDVNVRRKAKLGGEGIPADMLFRHHGKCYDNMHITLYDENYNGRWRENKLPPLRHWDSQTLGWLPEKTDHPLRGEFLRALVHFDYAFTACLGFRDM